MRLPKNVTLSGAVVSRVGVMGLVVTLQIGFAVETI